MGDQCAVDQHIERLAGQTIEFDHRALVELQQVTDVDVGAAHFHGNRHRDIEDHIQVRTVERDRIVVFRHAAEFFHRQAIGRRARGISGQQGIDVVLPAVARLFQSRSPFIGQRLVVLGIHVVSHHLSSACNCSIRNSHFANRGLERRSAALDRLDHLQRKVAFVRAHLDLEGRYAISAHDHFFGHFHRDNIARLHVQNVPQT